MNIEKIVLNEERHVTLTAYLQGVGGEFRNIARRPAMLILPGGAYRMCSEREADPIAFPYLEAGFQAFILRYSVRENATWPNPLNDYEQAITLIRERAEEWGIAPDKIAVIGFSAGGHLACAAATMSVNRPNAAILGYALCGNDVKHFFPEAPGTIESVDEKTCPCFLFHTCNDNVVSVHNALDFASALSRAKVPYECHIYSFGPHGISVGDATVLTNYYAADPIVTDRAKHWVPDSIGFLREIFGDFGVDGFTKPRI